MKVPLNSEKVIITSNYGNREYYYQGKLVKNYENEHSIARTVFHNKDSAV